MLVLENTLLLGADPNEVLKNTQEKMLRKCIDIDLIGEQKNCAFTTNNIVYTADISRQIDLEKLSVAIGSEQVEYEPEQFLGLIYKSNRTASVGLIFSSGKVVITGATNKPEAQKNIQSN